MNVISSNCIYPEKSRNLKKKRSRNAWGAREVYCQLLRGNAFTNCYVYPVDAGAGYPEQTFTKAYLPTTDHLYVHYYSDFWAYFDNQVKEYHWLCVDYFDTTYGDKIYDEETGEYVVEIFETCSVCGYEEQGTEELDNSYDVYLSIPVEIPLTFDAKEEVYSGNIHSDPDGACELRRGGRHGKR